MKKVLKRIALALVLVLVLGTSAFAVAVAVRQNRTFDAPYPDLHASTDPALIARGRYLVEGPAHCVVCHMPNLSGGFAFHLPIGTVYSRNITPDKVTGIGRYSDPELARVLRHGVRPDGRALLPFMPFANLADADLVAILSFLRSVPAVEHRVPAHDFNILGRIAKAFLVTPQGPTGTPPASITPEPTAAYGGYIANSIANCNGCHTRRDLKTGKQLGVTFAGGMTLESHSEPGTTFVTPNLTPDPKTGHIYVWSEDVFVARFHNAVETPSPMPWGQFRTMSETDLRALYRYFRSLPPATKGQAL